MFRHPSVPPRPNNRPVRYGCYGNNDFESPATASRHRTTTSRGRDQTDHRQQGRRGYNEVHHGTRTGGLPACRILLTEVKPLPREEFLQYSINKYSMFISALVISSDVTFVTDAISKQPPQCQSYRLLDEDQLTLSYISIFANPLELSSELRRIYLSLASLIETCRRIDLYL